ncbi:MAG: epoxide hydrolase [Acidimicrobiia bacterium]|nr:epoxide hydrolase [Acidimicrobiia bacterium]
MPAPQRIQVDIPQADLDDLRARLRNTRWPVDPGNADGRYGAQASWMRDLVGYWAEDYDWRAVEAQMNAYEHYKVDIDGVPIHYQRVPGQGPNPMPLILTHGWPWTFWDLHKVVDPLADPAAHGGDPADSFDVIVPSLPGYGLSVPLQRTGIGAVEVAELWVKLMRDVLGFDRFGAQGGDWGAIITAQMGHAFAEYLFGVYLTMSVIPASFGERGPRREEFAADEQWMLERAAEARRSTEAHVSVHRRDPQTLAYAMADSPAGLGAWLWHRRDIWSDRGAIESFGRDDLCTLASLYWFNSSFASAIRLYAEQFNRPQTAALVHERSPIIEAPTGYGVFAKDLLFVPRSFAERHTNLHRWSVFPEGGHFAPPEQPEVVVRELREFFRPLR